MEIVGGSFGASGRAVLTSDGQLKIDSASQATYKNTDICDISSRVESERKFGFIGFFIGVIMLSVILGLIFNVFGIILAIIISVAGSFYSKKHRFADIVFADGKKLSLRCSASGIDRLYKFKG